jgi:hypothetical protein
MNIIVAYRSDIWRDRPVECYPRCYVRDLRRKGYKVLEIGEGHDTVSLRDVNQSRYDLLLEIENGRSQNGKLRFQSQNNEISIPSAIIVIDSHGHPDIHAEIASSYDHVFFAVWDKRDIFAGHPSAHWCPNTSDSEFFNFDLANYEDEISDFGFFGSKGGLKRADILKEVCNELGLSCDVRQIGKNYRHRWPQTAHAMIGCNFLFNKGQKHDGPNQRVIESMLCAKPLFNDIDDRDGMSKLFVEGKHFIGYKGKEDLREKILWAIDNREDVGEISANAYEEAMFRHQVRNRVDQILEVFGV